MPKKVTSKVNIRCMWMLPYARYYLQSLNHFSIVIIPVVWTTRTYLVSEERATCWIADSLLGSLRKHLEKVQSRNTKSSRQMFSFPFFNMYFIGRFCTQSDVSRQSPVWSMAPNWPSNKNMTAPEITKKAKHKPYALLNFSNPKMSIASSNQTEERAYDLYTKQQHSITFTFY